MSLRSTPTTALDNKTVKTMEYSEIHLGGIHRQPGRSFRGRFANRPQKSVYIDL